MVRFFKLYKRDLIAFLVLIFAFWGLTYTADWEGYQLMYDGEINHRDILILYLTDYSVSHGLDFRTFYRFQCLLLTIAYLFVFRKLHANALVMSIVLLLIEYVAVANQVRYFLAFPLSIIALYELVLNKRIVLYFSLTILAFFSHSSIVLLHLAFGLMYIINKYAPNKKYILVFFLNLLILFVLQRNSIMVDEKYQTYFSQVASLKGSIYNSLTYILAFYLIVKRKRMLDKYNLKSEYLDFLFVLTVCDYIFFFTGMTYQIISHRLLGSMLPVGIIYLIQTDKMLSYKGHNEAYFLILFSLLHTYIMPDLLGLVPHTKNELLLMLNSYKL